MLSVIRDLFSDLGVLFIIYYKVSHLRKKETSSSRVCSVFFVTLNFSSDTVLTKDLYFVYSSCISVRSVCRCRWLAQEKRKRRCSLTFSLGYLFVDFSNLVVF